jgi:hypothetical protein
VLFRSRQALQPQTTRMNTLEDKMNLKGECVEAARSNT